MNSELQDNKELQDLIHSLGTEDEQDQPLGKYGRMAMKHLQETDPQRFSLLKMQGGLMTLMHKVDEEATEKVEAISQKLLEQDPMPKTDDILERTHHLNKHRDIAEEIVINEMVLIPR
jgi:hypothetical protein